MGPLNAAARRRADATLRAWSDPIAVEVRRLKDIEWCATVAADRASRAVAKINTTGDGELTGCVAGIYDLEYRNGFPLHISCTKPLPRFKYKKISFCVFKHVLNKIF